MIIISRKQIVQISVQHPGKVYTNHLGYKAKTSRLKLKCIFLLTGNNGRQDITTYMERKKFSLKWVLLF